jgi:cyclophilin family peptidyl-prolyl cis-trans isomerase
VQRCLNVAYDSNRVVNPLRALLTRLESYATAMLILALTAPLGAAPIRPNRDKPQEESATPRVVLDTNLGNIVIELYADKAPISVNNFLQYVDAQHYDGTIVHRVIPSFMIQGGGFATGMNEKKARDPIKNESANGLSNERGSIAVARAANPDSGTAQFFINLVNNQRLDRANSPDKAGYCVFGKVVSGMEVVDRIAQAPTGQQGAHANVPTPEVVIRSMRRVANLP